MCKRRSKRVSDRQSADKWDRYRKELFSNRKVLFT